MSCRHKKAHKFNEMAQGLQIWKMSRLKSASGTCRESVKRSNLIAIQVQDWLWSAKLQRFCLLCLEKLQGIKENNMPSLPATMFYAYAGHKAKHMDARSHTLFSVRVTNRSVAFPPCTISTWQVAWNMSWRSSQPLGKRWLGLWSFSCFAYTVSNICRALRRTTCF